MYPARTSSLWLATSASAGASRRVGIKSCDQRCMVMLSNRERISDCKRRRENARVGADAFVRPKDYPTPALFISEPGYESAGFCLSLLCDPQNYASHKTRCTQNLPPWRAID